MKIKILEEAEKDIEEGYSFYEFQSAGIHQVVFGYNRRLSKRFPFAIYYKLLKGEVLVFAVLDCRRNPSWIRERLKKA